MSNYTMALVRAAKIIGIAADEPNGIIFPSTYYHAVDALTAHVADYAGVDIETALVAVECAAKELFGDEWRIELSAVIRLI